MFPHLLRRGGRRSRTSLLPRPLARERHVPWRRPMTWAAVVMLIASALYFSIYERDEAPASGVPAGQAP